MHVCKYYATSVIPLMELLFIYNVENSSAYILFYFFILGIMKSYNWQNMIKSYSKYILFISATVV